MQHFFFSNQILREINFGKLKISIIANNKKVKVGTVKMVKTRLFETVIAKIDFHTKYANFSATQNFCENNLGKFAVSNHLI